MPTAPYVLGTAAHSASTAGSPTTTFLHTAQQVAYRQSFAIWGWQWDWDFTPATKTISGTIYDTTSVGVSGATVVLIREADGVSVASTTTDGAGNYSFTRGGDDPHTYHVEAYTSATSPQVHGMSDRGATPA